MILQEIIEMIEAHYPLEYACDWDNSGLQVGDRDQVVDTVYLALDPTDEAIEAAGREGAQLLLTHHPLLFSGLKQVTTDSLQGGKVIALIRQGTASYAMHTNYDTMGLAQIAAEQLELSDPVVLEEVLDGEGIGRSGKLPKEMTLAECAAFVKERFDVPSVKVFGNLEQPVYMAALCPGAGKSLKGAALVSGADVFITGDIDHHTGLDLEEMGMAVIDAGHYGTERLFLDDMERFLKKTCPELRVFKAPIKHPFQVL